MKAYRQDIDGVRAIAVLSVIFFHLGFLPNGYLGVDVFFVISGYLITSIIYYEFSQNKFSLWQFYQRRIRRILPLSFFVALVALIWGIVFMLPDDLENLAQSVIASNFSVNNILMLITSSDYWSIQNDYKPLMHTWSLGVEEQFYLVYPFILLGVTKLKRGLIPHTLVFLTLVSLVLFLISSKESEKFFLLHFRFFELSIGGLFAVLFFNKEIKNQVAQYIWLISLIGMALLLFVPYHNNQLNVILVTIFTVIVLTLGQYNFLSSALSKSLLQNKIMVYIGKISFSLYLWHQVVFAFSRYSFIEEITPVDSILLIGITFIFSIFTYHFLENPFRDKKKYSLRKVLISLSVLLALSSGGAMYLYGIGGVYKDFPSVGIAKSDLKKSGFNFFSSTDNIHIRYNEDVKKLEKPFDDTTKINVVIIGNSFGRDVFNIFLESSISANIELRYFNTTKKKRDDLATTLIENADLIIFCARDKVTKNEVDKFEQQHSIMFNHDKFYLFGSKDFGFSNGIHYQRLKSIEDFSKYYSKIDPLVVESEIAMKQEWGSRYVSLLEPVSNSRSEVRVFTNEGVFISPDTEHLTQPGAKFYAKILSEKLEGMIRPFLVRYE